MYWLFKLQEKLNKSWFVTALSIKKTMVARKKKKLREEQKKNNGGKNQLKLKIMVGLLFAKKITS